MPVSDTGFLDALPHFLKGIMTGAPLWVWPLLLVLLALGLRASRPRETSLLPLCLLPLIGLSNVSTLTGLADPALAWKAWSLAYLLGAGLGFLQQGAWIVERRGWRAHIKGEWLTLTTMMLLFWANFANGTIATLAPNLAASTLYLILFPALIGLASGSFLGRPLRLLTWNNALQPA
jgi:hypothetical protein